MHNDLVKEISVSLYGKSCCDYSMILFRHIFVFLSFCPAVLKHYDHKSEQMMDIYAVVKNILTNIVLIVDQMISIQN